MLLTAVEKKFSTTHAFQCFSMIHPNYNYYYYYYYYYMYYY